MELLKRKLNKINIKQIDFDIREIYTLDTLRKKKIFPIRKDEVNQNLTLAVSDLNDTSFLTEIRKENQGYSITFYETPEIEILSSIDEYEKEKEKKLNDDIGRAISSFESYQIDGVDLENQVEKVEDITETLNENASPVVNGVNAILANAINMGASDIHIEPYEKEIRIRYRVDGILTTVNRLPINLMPSISSRIKILANLNISETRRAQDGRFRLRASGKDIDFRLSTLLLAGGEKIVLRILDKSANALDLKILGFDDKSFEKIEHAITSPYGLILVTGPTGSGKSTTLYSVLDKLNKPDVNISTVEDPVEYNVEGINQVQYNEEIENTFSNVLRAFLRQDPDVIMIGEIRDGETASIAIKSSLTGHLVLSTLHTNSATATIDRLLNMGVERSLVASAVTLVISQRLIRKICPHCAGKEEKKLEKLKALEIHNVEDYKDIEFKKAVGCPKCNNLGYKGRSVVYEVLSVDPELREAINDRKSNDDLYNIAKKNGMDTLKDVAIEKAINGVTSLDEIIRLL